MNKLFDFDIHVVVIGAAMIALLAAIGAPEPQLTAFMAGLCGGWLAIRLGDLGEKLYNCQDRTACDGESQKYPRP